MNAEQNKQDRPTERKPWRKPVVVVHGDLLALTRAKNPGGTDSGLGTPAS